MTKYNQYNTNDGRSIGKYSSLGGQRGLQGWFVWQKHNSCGGVLKSWGAIAPLIPTPINDGLNYSYNLSLPKVCYACMAIYISLLSTVVCLLPSLPISAYIIISSFLIHSNRTYTSNLNNFKQHPYPANLSFIDTQILIQLTICYGLIYLPWSS